MIEQVKIKTTKETLKIVINLWIEYEEWEIDSPLNRQQRTIISVMQVLMLKLKKKVLLNKEKHTLNLEYYQADVLQEFVGSRTSLAPTYESNIIQQLFDDLNQKTL